MMEKKRKKEEERRQLLEEQKREEERIRKENEELLRRAELYGFIIIFVYKNKFIFGLERKSNFIKKRKRGSIR